MRDQFLAGAQVVAEAAADTRVVAAWDEPSILVGQTIGGLVGHLCRGTIWVVEDYLDLPEPVSDPVFDTAADYYARISDRLTDADHAAIRDRGADVAEEGHSAVVARAGEALARLRTRLPGERSDRTLPVFGSAVMRLDDYLYTRVVEQVVHLDDLARSIGADPWPNPPDAEALVIACGAEIGRRRRGGPAMLRALFRDGESGTLPVL